MNQKFVLLVLAVAGAPAAWADRYPPEDPVTPVEMSAPAASAPLPPPGPPARARQRGSLYDDQNFQALTSDRRRFTVGESLTIQVLENASASSSADTGAARDSQVGLGVQTPNWNKRAGISANNDYTGGGRTQRSGRLLAHITVLVHEILPNGDLRVAGEQLLEINGEKQVIRAEGRVRPRDVSEHNVVLSSRLAEARLAFVGDGVVGEQQRPRWWQRVLGLFGI